MVRALLKRPVVLVFDQAAAVLDPTTQLRVVENVLHERKGKTVVWCCRARSSPTASISCW